MGQRVVFLDRDGVLNKAFPEGGTTRPPASVDELELLPGVERALARLRGAGFVLVVVTNQPDVARGTQTRAAVERINAELYRALPLLDVLACFHDTADKCSCRKPKPGMLTAAAAKWNLDLSGAFLIGDRWSDVAAARAAGCRGVLIDTPFGQPERCAPDHVAPDITSAVDWVLATSAGEVAGRSAA
ncbi:D-glycero-beta-D-manno-heptose-1,7-bisphosphate 7-phosphatase [Gemmata sp. SH-PL17]|uniref:D-glycero-alpha-D-manno-heptose-1,7-bisphosphate 7-phosphatase n=1 Tax=Gemmata sp. SH-PL17 TaxID=1630693 RepID=UPI00078DA3A8|nr:HAD-IIIA family hydrolase [Gemmata sp. SH-PL17]AMV24142.1 D-glycero-beta-D-manno-heptose-1,7-bisphosphate 7-phosphatase [Gemmata sp. SH-PL17]